ncbi:MAG: DUF72 domain-containing protein [Planctomycetota bacterium]|jgi:uncharacterized protein YecE (DUF72 family)
MGKVGCDIRIGTSGWHYGHWSGRFYPLDLPKSKWFLHYAQHFDTVEINNTFYHLPKPKSVENWHKQAPDNFLYTVKANRYITHIKRLRDSQEPLERFFEIARLLKEKRGPVLYQLPPSMHKDLDRLESFLRLLPKGVPAVFEFRHESWFAGDTYEMLNEFDAGFCTHDLPGRPSPRIITGDLIYLRFHGTTGRYSGNYSKSALQEWAHWTKDNLKGIRTVYAYFNNDYNAYAVHNAKQLRELL